MQVHAFHSLWNVVQRFASLRPFNRRNHRKLTIVDDRVAYFGGMNIVDQSGIQSVNDAKDRHLPMSAGWRDVHVRLEGPQQAEIVHCMETCTGGSQHGERRLPWPRWRIQEMLAVARGVDLVLRFRPAVAQAPARARARAVDPPGARADHRLDGLLHPRGPGAARAAARPPPRRRGGGHRAGNKRRAARAMGQPVSVREAAAARHSHLRAARTRCCTAR